MAAMAAHLRVAKGDRGGVGLYVLDKDAHKDIVVILVPLVPEDRMSVKHKRRGLDAPRRLGRRCGRCGSNYSTC